MRKGIGKGNSPNSIAALKPIKKGAKKHPLSGRLKLPPDLIQIKKIHKDEVDRLIAKVLRLDFDAVNKLQLNTKLSSHEL